jgi:predicted Zn-dependent protease
MEPQDRVQAQSLIRAQAWSEARAFLSNLSAQADDIDWLALRAEVEASEGNLEAAATLYEQILDLRPQHRGALYNLSLTLSDLERHEDAMEILERLIETEGESAEVLNDLAFEYMEAGHHVPARLAAARAEQLASDEGQRCLARLNAATALANMGRFAEARTQLDRMLGECTGICGERTTATELRHHLSQNHLVRTSTA